MSKNRNYHKTPVVAKDRFVGVRLDKECFSKVEKAAMTAGLSISEYIRRALTRRKITIKEEIVVEVPIIKELIAALRKIGANLNQSTYHFNMGGVLSQRMYKETMKAYADLYAMKVGIEKLGGAFRSHPEAYGRKKQRLRQMHAHSVAKPNFSSAVNTIPKVRGMMPFFVCSERQYSDQIISLP